MSDFSLDWAYACGRPDCHGTIRTTADDFQVDEVLGYEPDGKGNHALLHIRKTNTNTEWLARHLAEFAGVELKEVGYAGLKDRLAVTTQYFSVNLSGRDDPDWSQLNSNEIEVLSAQRHGKKLRRGGLRENCFQITVRDLHGGCTALEQRLQTIKDHGVPNYFGEQRFGHDRNNLKLAEQLFRSELHERDRHKRGIYLSAARSWLFNLVLSQRVGANNWQLALPGEVLIQRHSRSALSLRLITPEIEQRIAGGHLLPSAPLWGRGASSAQGEALEIERLALSSVETFQSGLEKAGLEQERRALKLEVKGLEWEWLKPDALQVRFSLPSGSYATAVLREICS
ncbi:MAG: tRNA pseudouridine(13) synthase TruD [Chromatiales bacterium]|nr:tRNA pseudouridine(13) synthase TruD [Chromatiales bacterium]